MVRPAAVLIALPDLEVAEASLPAAFGRAEGDHRPEDRQRGPPPGVARHVPEDGAVPSRYCRIADTGKRTRQLDVSCPATPDHADQVAQRGRRPHDEGRSGNPDPLPGLELPVDEEVIGDDRRKPVETCPTGLAQRVDP